MTKVLDLFKYSKNIGFNEENIFFYVLKCKAFNLFKYFLDNIRLEDKKELTDVLLKEILLSGIDQKEKEELFSVTIKRGAKISDIKPCVWYEQNDDFGPNTEVKGSFIRYLGYKNQKSEIALMLRHNAEYSAVDFEGMKDEISSYKENEFLYSMPKIFHIFPKVNPCIPMHEFFKYQDTPSSNIIREFKDIAVNATNYTLMLCLKVCNIIVPKYVLAMILFDAASPAAKVNDKGIAYLVHNSYKTFEELAPNITIKQCEYIYKKAIGNIKQKEIDSLKCNETLSVDF